MPRGALLFYGGGRGGRRPPLETSLRRAGPPGLARLSSLCHHHFTTKKLSDQGNVSCGPQNEADVCASSMLVGFRTLGARGRKRCFALATFEAPAPCTHVSAYPPTSCNAKRRAKETLQPRPRPPTTCKTQREHHNMSGNAIERVT